MDLSNPQVEEREKYGYVSDLRDKSEQLHRDIDAVRQDGRAMAASDRIVRDKERELHEIEAKLLLMNEDRCRERYVTQQSLFIVNCDIFDF